MSYGQRQPATQRAVTGDRPGILRRLLHAVGAVPDDGGQGWRPDRRQPWGKGTGRASYGVVQRRRRANRVASRSRRINRRSR